MKTPLALSLLTALLAGCSSPPARPPSSEFDAYESAEHPGWLQVDSGPGRFSALMPSAVVRRTVDGWQQTRASSLGQLFVVSYRDDPALSGGQERRHALDRQYEQHIAQASEVQGREPFAAFGVWGSKLVFRQRESGRWVSVRMLVLGTRFYQLAVLSAPGEPLPEAEAAVFFQSFVPELP